MKFETVAVHAGGARDETTGAVAPPIHLSTTFEHAPATPLPGGYVYVRQGNPTQDRLEEALAAVEGGDRALCFASGLAAAALLLQTLPTGSHVLFPEDVYHGVRRLATDFLPRWGLQATLVDMTRLDRVRAVLRPDTRLVWVESPSNPLLRIVDISAVAALAHEVSARLLVDGTFATPALQRPLALGADVVLHSTTKYVCGHSDAQGGALVFAPAGDRVDEILRARTILGSVSSPFNAWLALRGLRSLACRMERHSATALTLAGMLDGHPSVEAVHYPGLPSHPGHEVARRQMRAFGGMLSFQVRGGRARAIEVASRLRLFVNATSLGGPESLVEHRVSFEGPDSATPENLLRLSVGLEHPDDLAEDLAQALDRRA